MLFAAGLLATSGCYAYHPPPAGASLAAGQQVRVTLNLSGTTELARYLGPRVEIAEGQLAAVNGDSLAIAVRYVTFLNGVREGWSGEGTVVFPRPYIEQLEVRTLQKRQTVLATTGAAASLAGLAVVAIRSGGVKGGPGGGGGPPPP